MQIDNTVLSVWTLAADFLTAAVLTFLAERSLWGGWKLPLALSAIHAGLNVINAVEAVVYLHISLKLVFACLGAGVLLLPIWKIIFRENEPGETRRAALETRGFGSFLWRFLLGCVSYVFLYLVAGIIILPFVKEFYATQNMPSLQLILELQIFFRGPLFVALCLLILHMVSFPRGKAIFTVAFLFALLSGVVPLMVPNSLFPDAIRWVHFGEVTSSNFVFGLIVAWLFSRSTRPLHQTAPLAVAAS